MSVTNHFRLQTIMPDETSSVITSRLMFHADDSVRNDLVSRRLWEKGNMESYIADMRKESKRRR